MRPTTCLLAVAVLTAIVFESDGSQVVFQASQEVIHPILTKLLRLRCSIQNNPPLSAVATSTSHHFVLGSTAAPSTTASTAKGAVSESGVSHVTAIIITKENKWTGLRDKVASVTPFDGAIDDSPNTGHFQVEGSSDRSPVVGEQGYLQVTWTRPLDDQAGVYFCEVFALNFDKHPISLWTSIQITSTEPSISDLVTYISEHDKQITELVEENRSLKNDIVLITMNETLNTTRTHNIQTGSVTRCSTSGQLISFPQHFYAIPKIFTSVPYLRHSASSSYATYTINIQSITQASFSISCSTTNMDINVDWIAID